MAIRDFVFPSSTAIAAAHSAPLSVKSDLQTRTVSITSAKPKPVRKAKNLAESTSVRIGWYESEDRTLPSVSSF